MDKTEAIQLATTFLAQQQGYEVLLTARDAILIQASRWPDLYANDTWAIHFPINLPDGILFQEPDSVVVTVDAVTREIRISNSL